MKTAVAVIGYGGLLLLLLLLLLQNGKPNTSRLQDWKRLGPRKTPFDREATERTATTSTSLGIKTSPVKKWENIYEKKIKITANWGSHAQPFLYGAQNAAHPAGQGSQRIFQELLTTPKATQRRPMILTVGLRHRPRPWRKR